jgi:rod shape-determining protein MreD
MTVMLLAPLPLLSTLLLIVVAVVPWGGPAWSETALALLPVAAIYFWSIRRPQLMPALLVFLIGLVLDVMTHGPLGVWAMTALAAAFSARVARRSRPAYGALRSGVHVIATLAVATALADLVLAAYVWQPVSPLVVLQACGAGVLAYPLVASLLSLLDALWPATTGRPLFLRGD